MKIVIYLGLKFSKTLIIIYEYKIIHVSKVVVNRTTGKSAALCVFCVSLTLFFLQDWHTCDNTAIIGTMSSEWNKYIVFLLSVIKSSKEDLCYF